MARVGAAYVRFGVEHRRDVALAAGAWPEVTLPRIVAVVSCAWAGTAANSVVASKAACIYADALEKKLGPKFNAKEFHDFVLLQGAVPLDLLEESFNEWLKGKKG